MECDEGDGYDAGDGSADRVRRGSTKLFAGKPTQYRKSKSLPKFTGEAMRACAKINRIFFDDPDEAYRLFHELVLDAGRACSSRRRSMSIMVSD